MSAGAVRGRPTPCSIASLPNIEDVASVPPEQVLPMVVHLSALQVVLATRLVVHPTIPESQRGTASRIVTPKQLAAELVFRLDRVYELARTGVIPSIRIGRTVRFDLDAVRKALAS